MDINMKPQQRRRFQIGRVAMAVGALVAATPGAVATATATMTASATVQATCLITTTPMAFGTYVGTVLETTSTISVTCTNTTPYNVGLSAGLGTGATVGARSMQGAAVALTYALFRDAARSLNWGNTVATDTQGGTGNGTAQALTVYGRIVAGQYVTPAAYSDSITATITY